MPYPRVPGGAQTRKRFAAAESRALPVIEHQRSLIAHIPRDEHEFLGRLHRKRPEKQRIEEAKDCGVGADAQGQGKHGSYRKARILAEPAQTVADVLNQCAHKRIPP